MFDPTAVYVVMILSFATLIRSALGFGEALVAVPLLALRLPVAVAAPLAVLASVLVAGVILIQDHREVEVRRAAGLVASAVPGLPLGWFLLAVVSDQMVKLALGLVIVVFSLYSLLASPALSPVRRRRTWLVVCGFCSGVLGGMYGMNGPPLAIYGAGQRWSPQHFRATLQAYFLPISLLGLVGYGCLGMLRGMVLRDSSLALPGMLLAVMVGRAINRCLGGMQFFGFVYVGLAGTGALLLAQAFHL